MAGKEAVQSGAIGVLVQARKVLTGLGRMVGIGLALTFGTHAVAEEAKTVVFFEAGFSAADTANPALSTLQRAFPQATFATSQELPALLNASSTRLLVLPYGSSFPEDVWPAIEVFVERGGNLLNIGGRPFTAAAFHDSSGWHVRDYSVRFCKRLGIDQYQSTPGSPGLSFAPNPNSAISLSAFQWKQAFSPIIHLSWQDLYHRAGSAGSIDSRLTALAWGIRDGRKMSAPAIQIDHYRYRFIGGRWIFINSELDSDSLNRLAAGALATLAERASRGSEEFDIYPTLPLYSAEESVELKVKWDAATKSEEPVSVKIHVTPDGSPGSTAEYGASMPMSAPLVIPAKNAKGLYLVTAELHEGKRLRAVAHTGFWIRDLDYLRSGPRLSVNHDYFEIDGKPIGVIGTTYMASDVQRLYFDHPNVYTWNEDLAQIGAAGLNMIRTGWWTGWDKFCDENGVPYERTLRTLEAYLMTARKNGLPVQFNLFAFLPEVLGGQNPYMDADAVRKQRTLAGALAARFQDIPFLAWDLINEPSFSQYLWRTRPNGDLIELARWNEWLRKRYPDEAALAAAWNVPRNQVTGTIPVPAAQEFESRSMYSGPNSARVFDYYLFAQESFAGWVKELRSTIRDAGSKQLITVGQDEGGYSDRLSPAFFGAYVDFTANHSWWQNDALLWDSMVAKQPGLALLIQETGLQRELTLDEIARRTADNEATLFERKVALSFVQGAGAIEWLWNTNSYMTEGNEVPIGALRADSTEKPEATVMRDFAKWAKTAAPDLKSPQRPAVAIVTSQAAQFSVIGDLQIEAQRRAVRALSYYCRTSGYIIAENQVAKLGTPQLVILPSPQALQESTWQALLSYVASGGNLLITGPVNRDEHWRRVDRASALRIPAAIEPLMYRNAELAWDGRAASLNFNLAAQSWLEAVRFADGETVKQIPHGKGRIFWAAYPVELSEEIDVSADLYAYVLAQAGIHPAFEVESNVSPGVLIHATDLQNAMLYVMESESSEPAHITLRDRATRKEITVRLLSQRAALVVIRKSDGVITARYGF